MGASSHTTNLNLPIYSNPTVDTFDLTEWNNANNSIENMYTEVINARDGEVNLLTKINNIDTSLADMKSQQINYKGIAVTIYSTTTNADMDAIFTKLANVNNYSIELCVMEYVNDYSDPNVTQISGITTLLDTFKAKATANGKTISMIKPHIGTVALQDSFIRSSYVPSSLSTFFTAWTSHMQTYATWCKNNNIPMLSISCEMEQITVSGNISYWVTLINTVKAVSSTLKVTFAYTKNELYRDASATVKDNYLSSKVDIIGLNLYPQLLRTDLSKYIYCYIDVNYQSISLDNWILRIADYNKPIIVTETGCSKYTNSSATIIDPINMTGTADNIDQATYLDTMLNYIFNSRYITGVFLWHVDTPFLVGNSSTTINKYFI